MTPLTIEGTWDEVAQRADDFVGKRVRVTVIEDAEPPRLDRVLAGLIEEAERLRDGRGRGGDAGAGTWGDSVYEKYRGQGFEL